MSGSKSRIDKCRQKQAEKKYKLSKKQAYIHDDSFCMLVLYGFKKDYYFLNSVDHQDIMSVLF